MCFRNQWFDEKTGLMSDITVNNLKKIIKTGSFDTVFFGGMGEPLIHPRLSEMINFSYLCGKQTELITNGTLLDGKMSEKLEKSGLNRLWISMDGFSKSSYEAIRRGSIYELITENIAAFNAARSKIILGISFVIMKENEYELKNINSFADRIGADIINLSHVIPEAPIEEKDVIYNKSYPVGKMTRFASDGKKKLRDVCPFIDEGACFVRWDGKVAPCMQLLHNSYTYLYTEKRKIYFQSYGSINEKNLADIWNDDEYTDFRKRVAKFEFPCCTVCLGCDDRLENKTDCMYNKSPTCGACLWSQGLIRCP